MKQSANIRIEKIRRNLKSNPKKPEKRPETIKKITKNPPEWKMNRLKHETRKKHAEKQLISSLESFLWLNTQKVDKTCLKGNISRIWTFRQITCKIYLPKVALARIQPLHSPIYTPLYTMHTPIYELHAPHIQCTRLYTMHTHIYKLHTHIYRLQVSIYTFHIYTI